MAVSEVLKNFRNKDYGSGSSKSDKNDSGGPRIIKLTDDEMKELQSYQKGPGEEQQCLVTGRLGDSGDFSVTSVHSPNGESTMPDQDQMAQEVMGKMGQPPMMQSQTIPSPS